KAPEWEKEAFNAVVDYVGEKENKSLADNKHFAKLYIYLFGEFLKHYQCTVFDETPQKELQRILKSPGNLLVTEVMNAMNTGELYRDPSGKTAKWEFDEVANNLMAMVNGAIRIQFEKTDDK